MNILEICQEYGLDLCHSDKDYTRVSYELDGERYGFYIGTHMFEGSRRLLGEYILREASKLANQTAKEELQRGLRATIGFKE